jgi:hypothetical protein
VMAFAAIGVAGLRCHHRKKTDPFKELRRTHPIVACFTIALGISTNYRTHHPHHLSRNGHEVRRHMAGTPGAHRAEGVPAMCRRRVKNAMGGTLGYFVEVVRPSTADEEVLWGVPYHCR